MKSQQHEQSTEPERELADLKNKLDREGRGYDLAAVATVAFLCVFVLSKIAVIVWEFIECFR